MKKELRYDEIGYWSEVKLDIIKDYATQYSTILSHQEKPPFYHIYIDAFAGAGKHKLKRTGEFVPGSPWNALLIKPPFKEYHFIDLDPLKTKNLESLFGAVPNVHVHQGDCNRVLLEKILPLAKYEDCRRALCVLDPYGLHVDWEVLEVIGKMKSVEIFYNFQVGDLNRNVLWRNPEGVEQSQIERMNRAWKDDSWRKICYTPSRQMNLNGTTDEEKASNKEVAKAFQNRLKEIAGFEHVPDPIPMRNSHNAVVYYLYFASHNPVAMKIVNYIFKKYRDRVGA